MPDPTSMKAPESPWPARAAWLGRAAVGAIFLFAGAVKALDPAGFAGQIDEYGWLPSGLTPLAALFFIGAELLLGAALILGVRPRAATWATCGMLGLFIAVSTDAWARGTVTDCGCFGSLADRGPGDVVIEDLLMVGLLIPTFFVGPGRPRPAWRTGVAVATALLGAGLALAAPHLPLDDLVTKLVPGAALKEMGLDALVPASGPVLVALLELEGEPSLAAVPGLNEVALALSDVPVRGLAVATPEERAMFGWTHGAGFPVEEVGASALRGLARELPRFALLVDGRVKAVWNENPPDPDAVRTVLGGTSS